MAVAGCGSIGQMHIRALEELGRTRLVAVSSRGEARAREIAEENGCAFTTDPVVLARRPDVEVVIVATSSGSHAPLALEALAAGKHVIVEKPMAMTSGEARRMIEAAASRRLMLAVISQRRFEETHQTIKRLVDGGALGKLLLLEASCPYFRTQEYYDSSDWRGTIAQDGGALMNQAIHSVDLLLWFGGPARAVYGRTATQTHRMEAEDLATAVVTFASGAIGTIMASTSIRPGFQPALNLYGEKGTIKLEGASVVHWTVPGFAQPEAAAETSAGVTSPQLASHRYHQAQLADILDALDGERRPAVMAADGFCAVELVNGVYESSRTGAPITLAGMS